MQRTKNIAQNILYGGPVGNDMETGTGQCCVAAKLAKFEKANKQKQHGGLKNKRDPGPAFL